MATKEAAVRLQELENGLRVVVAPLPGARSATVAIFAGAGSRYETPEINGVSHFLEHLFFGGTKKRPSSQEISESIESVGGYFNAYTGEDKTCYYAKVPAQHLERAFDVIVDMLTESVFDEAKIERERGVVLEEINLYSDDPGKQVQERFGAVVWPDQPLGMTVLGPKEVISTIQRDAITGYVAARYAPSNLVIAVAGAVDLEGVRKMAERYLGGLKDHPVSAAEPARNVPGSRTKAIKRKIDQTHFMIGAYAPDLTDPTRYQARLLNAVLGEGMSSRLFLRVREERGLAYSVHSFYEGLADTGVISVRAGVNVAKTDEAIGAVVDEFKRLQDERVPDSELAKAREYVKGSMQLRLEDSSALADWLGSQLTVIGRYHEVDEILRAYDAVTPEQVQEMAQQIFAPDNRHLIAIGPTAEEARIRQVFRKGSGA